MNSHLLAILSLVFSAAFPALAARIDWGMECNEGNSMACHKVAESAVGVGNKNVAIRYFSRACDLKLALGSYEAATLLEQEGKATDAHGLFARACDLNDAITCAALGNRADREGKFDIARKFHVEG